MKLEHLKKLIGKNRKTGFGRKAVAALLAFVLSCQILPAVTFADEDDGSSTTSADLAWKTLAGKNDNVGSGRAVGNTYILEVTSGTRSGGGAAENVLYFAIVYTSRGNTFTEFIVPPEDAVSRGYNLARGAGYRSARDQLVKDLFGYTNDLEARPALGSVETSQLMFTTQYPIEDIQRIQVFGKRTNAASDWVCQGMRVHSVETLYGLDMYGWYSDYGYIDFEGSVIAEVEMTSGAGYFRWDTSGGPKMIAHMGDAAGESGMILVTNRDKSSYESSYGTSTNIGRRHTSQANNKVVLRIDFADVGLAGFESLAGSYAAGSNTKISDLKFCETAALRVRYEDIYGDTRDVYLPLAVNAIGQVAAVLQDVPIVGYAQQGDSIAMALMLPDYSRLDLCSIIIGEAEARARASITRTADFNNPIRNARAQKSESDSVDYICFAIYNNYNEVQIALEGATVRYKFPTGTNNPNHFSASSSTSGMHLPVKQEEIINMQNYYDQMVLRPNEVGEKYLVTLSTDNVENAGTVNDVYMKLHYLTLKDKEVESQEYNIHDYITQFYGEWPGNVEDFAYLYGMRQGGTVQFIVPLEGVKEFTGISFRIAGEDEWQFSGVSIAKVKSYDSRHADWDEIVSDELDAQGKPKYLSHVRYTRNVTTDSVSFQIGKVYDPMKENPRPEDDNWKAGTLVQGDNTETTYRATGEVVDRREVVDWRDYMDYMTYEDAKQDFGFAKQRCNYKVTVKVAGDKVNEDDDDCGSKNLFYFQLLFENGKSGCVLANQQIIGDAFRTGAQVEFNIPTNMDYGELQQITVIPDAQDENGDIYDKLKIEYIKVELETDGAICPTWTARSAGADGLGWVEIPYEDPGVSTTTGNYTGHAESEISTTYDITDTTFTAKFLVSITTGSYGTTPGLDRAGNWGAIPDEVLRGGMSMSFHYFDSDGRLQYKEGIDVIEEIYKYSGKTGSHTRTYDVDGEEFAKEVDYFVSDPQYNFRTGRTDNFFITIDDIWKFADMSLQIRSDVVTKWNIESVKIFLIRGQGTRYLNNVGEYTYRYAEGYDPYLVSKWTRTENLVKAVQKYRDLQNTSIGEIRFPLEQTEITLDSAVGKWTSKISREPTSTNDTLNLFIYPQETSDSASPTSYNPTAAIRYVDGLNMRPMQVATGTLNRSTDENGRTVFYALGVNARDMQGLSGVDFETNTMRSSNVPIDYGIVQRMRGGILIDTYYLTGNPNADPMGTLYVANTTTYNSYQRVLLQVSKDTLPQVIEPESKDLAVAVYFRTNDPGTQEIRSKYIYLSDLGYTSIRPGQVLDMTYYLGDVSEITGINIASIGKLNVNFDEIMVANQNIDGRVLLRYGIQGLTMPSTTPSRVAFGGNVQLVEFEFETAPEDGTADSGTDGPIHMILGYYDEYNVLRELDIEDAKLYVQSGDGFKTGGKDYFRMLVPNLKEVRYVKLEPTHTPGTGDTSGTYLSTWRLRKLTETTGLDGKPIVRAVNKQLVERDPTQINLAELLLSATVILPDSTTRTVTSGETFGATIESGQSVRIEPTVFGSNSGYRATLEAYDPVTQTTSTVRLNGTYAPRYTDEYLSTLEAKAKDRAANAPDESTRQAAAQVVAEIANIRNQAETDGGWNGTDISFKAPPNFGDSVLNYRITVISVESSDVTFTIDVKVNPIADNLTAAVDLWTKLDPDATVAETVTVTFNTDGGNSISPITVVKGEYISEPTTNRDPYTFDKWVTSDGNVFDFDMTAITENITLTATWIDPVNVTFVYHPERDTKDGRDEDLPVKIGEKMNAPTPPDATTDPGMTFKGWFLTEEAVEGEKAFDVTTPITEDITLYAHWTVEVVFYDGTYAGGTLKTITLPLGATYDTIPAESIPTAGGQGFVITKWLIEPNGAEVQPTDKFERDATLYASYD